MQQRLSGLDAAFWWADTHSCPMHIGALGMRSARGPGFSFDAVRDLIVSRLPELPVLRYRVVGARHGLDRPWLIDDDTSTSTTTCGASRCPPRAGGTNSRNWSAG